MSARLTAVRDASPERRQEARVYAARIDRVLIEALRSGEVVANDPATWIAELEASAAEVEVGKHDHNFTIWQRMHLFLTGDCVPLFALPVSA